MIAVVPGYKELDVSAVFLIFLSIFFAFIIGDAGYGLLFLLGTLFAKFKYKSPKIKCGLNLMLVMSSCTVILGILTGNYFGIPIENLPKYLQLITNPFLTGWEDNLSVWNKKNSYKQYYVRLFFNRFNSFINCKNMEFLLKKLIPPLV